MSQQNLFDIDLTNTVESYKKCINNNWKEEGIETKTSQVLYLQSLNTKVASTFAMIFSFSAFSNLLNISATLLSVSRPYLSLILIHFFSVKGRSPFSEFPSIYKTTVTCETARSCDAYSTIGFCKILRVLLRILNTDDYTFFV